MFQRALKLQKEGEFYEANKLYDELFGIEVISNDSHFASPTIKTLRYLAHRNRGLLHFDELRSQIQEITPSDALENLFDALDDLVEALQHTEGDLIIINLLLCIFNFFGNDRLSRFLIEYELSKDENDDFYLHEKSRVLSPNFLLYLRKEKEILEKIGCFTDSESKSFKDSLTFNSFTTTKLEDLSFLEPIRSIIDLRHSTIQEGYQKNITIDKLSWTTIASKLYQQTARGTLRNNKYRDGYNLQETPFVPIRFNLPSEGPSPADSQQNEKEDVEISDTHSGNETQEEQPIQNKESVKNSPSEPTSSSKAKESPSIVDSASAPLSASHEADSDIEILDAGLSGTGTSTKMSTSTDMKHEEQSTVNVSSSSENSLKRAPSEGQQTTQRASKRFRQQAESEPETNNFDEFQMFCDNVNHYLEKVGLKITQITAVLASSCESEPNELYLKDFYNCLDNWTSRHAEFLSFNSSKSQNGLALNELINTNIINASLSSDVAFKDFSDDYVSDFIQSVNTSSLHFCEVRYKFLSVFMGNTNGSYPLIDFHLGRDLFTSIETLVLTSETLLFDELEVKDDAESTAVSVAMLEIIVNHWIQLRQKVKSKGLSAKMATDLNHKIGHIQRMIQRWRKVVTGKLEKANDDFFSMRMRWISLLYLQHEQQLSVQYMKKLLFDLYTEFEEKHQDLTIQFPNYELIPTLNAKMIKNQSDKLNVLTTFESTMSSEEENSNHKSEEANLLLETVLLAENPETFTDEQNSMKDFVNASSVSLQLKLWKILLDSYITTGDLTKYQKGLTIALPILFNQITGKSYNQQAALQRQQLLLNTIGFYGDYISGLSHLLEKHSYKTENVNKNLFEHIVSFMRIMICYILHDYSNTTKSFHQVAQRSSSRIREIILNTLIVVFCFYTSLIGQDDVGGNNGLFSVLHEEVGKHEFCDAGSGNFLRLSQEIWKSADPEIFESDILQHLNCRFHICITSDKYTPYDHHTKDMAIDKTSAIAFFPCLMNLILRKRDPLFNVLKPDLKSALDSFYKAIGEPDENYTIIQKNSAAIGQFLDMEINKSIFKCAYMGSLDFKLRKTLLDEQVVADQGIFYAEAVSSLNMYKVRKKAMQAKASDLEDILKMVKADLVYGSENAEPWFLLGQTFSLQVEDDLIWTSDKLNVPDKKEATAATQRKSILCFLMALNILIRREIEGKEVRQSVFAMCLSYLSRELYHGLTKPMSGLCFETKSWRAILTDRGDVSVVPFASLSCQRAQLFTITLHTVKMAIQVDKNDWLNYFYLAQSLHKLNKDPKEVINASLKACELNRSGIEPHYQLCSYIYKYGKRGLLSEKTALQCLHDTKYFFGPLEESSDEHKLESLVLRALKKISHIDKKKWHHKHRYKLSKIYYDLQEFDKSYEEMESLIILKSTNKNLVSIWKPELEPPGKHFVYTYNYILYYIKLADTLADFQKLLLFTKKLRRYGAGMINLNDAWDTSCTTLCLLVKDIIGAEPGYTDLEVPKLIYPEFMQASQTLAEEYKFKSLDHEEISLMTLLYEISEIRRMNNGFGSTSQLDDTFNSIFLKIYIKNVTEENKAHFLKPQQTLNKHNNGPVKTKVARRDILASATLLVRSVEPKLKEHKITDDKGFDVPEHVKQKHLEEAKRSIAGATKTGVTITEKTETTGIESAVTEITNPQVQSSGATYAEDSIVIKEPPTNLSKDSSIVEATTPNAEELSKTPENKGSASGRSNNESDDEFHTPTNTFEGITES